MTRRAAPIHEFREPGRAFKKSAKGLPEQMKAELTTVIDELLSGNLPNGRRYEKLDIGDDLCSVRLNQSYRFVFRLDPADGTALPVAVGPHDEAYQQARRSTRR